MLLRAFAWTAASTLMILARAAGAAGASTTPPATLYDILGPHEADGTRLMTSIRALSTLRPNDFDELDWTVRKLGERLDAWVLRVSEVRPDAEALPTRAISGAIRIAIRSALASAALETRDNLNATGLMGHEFVMSRLLTRKRLNPTKHARYEDLARAASDELTAVGIDATVRFELELAAEPFIGRRTREHATELLFAAERITQDLRAIRDFDPDADLRDARELGRSLSIDLFLFINQIRNTKYKVDTDATAAETFAAKIFDVLEIALKRSQMPIAARNDLVGALAEVSKWTNRVAAASSVVLRQFAKTRELGELANPHDPRLLRDFTRAFDRHLSVLTAAYAVADVPPAAGAASTDSDDAAFADQSTSVREIGMRLLEITPARAARADYPKTVLKFAQQIDRLGEVTPGRVDAITSLVAMRAGLWLRQVAPAAESDQAVSNRPDGLATFVMDILEERMALIPDAELRLSTRRALLKKLGRQAALFRTVEIFATVVRPIARDIRPAPERTEHQGLRVITRLRALIRATCEQNLTNQY